METFQKDNEKLKAEKMPKIEEGKEATEEQKKEIAKISTEFEQMNIKKINEITSEMENMVFNTNVFKNVQLAMSEEEKKVEEDKVRDLAKFIKDKAIANLIARLEQNQYESVPSDSSTLKDLFHSNGINIRYLGYIADQVKDNKKLIYLKYMLEREVVIRCIKHILN
jgi:protein TIF31